MVLAAIAMISVAPTLAIAQNNITNATGGGTNQTTTTTNQTTTTPTNQTTTTTNKTTTTPVSNATSCTCNQTQGNKTQVIVVAPPSNNTNVTNGNVTIPPTPPTNETKLKTMLLTIDTDHATIQRGQTQKITIAATSDNGTGIPDVKIASLTLNYASGANRTIAAGSTDQNGQFITTTKIGGNSKPGEFNIIASAKKDGYIDAKAISGFVVNPKSK